MKRSTLSLVGAIIAFVGLVWFLQGAGILPGSFMSGSQLWEVVGAIVLIIGITIIGVSVKRTGTP
jgi:hypothetical protein